jgi:predicted transposase YbfD/YdcC
MRDLTAERRIAIAQEKVPEKRDERQALPQLLNIVNVEGALVSVDAFFAINQIYK